MIDTTNTDRIVSPDLNGENEMFRAAATAVQAGIAATAKKYSEIDNENASKNPERGTIPDGNNKSVHYLS